MAQPNRATSFVVAAAAIAAAVAVASLEDLAVAVRNYKSLALFLYFFGLQQPLSLLLPFFPMFAPALNSICGKGRLKKMYFILLFLQGVF